MNFFSNPEIKLSLFIHIAATVIFTGAGFFFGYSHGSALCLWVLGMCLVFTCLHFAIMYPRYRRIYCLSQELDLVLHGVDSLSFSDYAEGELSILTIEIEKMLLRLREQSHALKQDKLSLASSMADISHQIRTPLTSIHLVLSMLSETDLSYERRIELTRQLSMLAARIDWLIEALLKISRLDAGTVVLKPESLSIAQVVETAVAPLEIPMELREQHFHFTENNSISNTPAMAMCDFAWTVEAISNILKNCMEHTPEGGEIRVQTSQNAIFAELIIEDNGPGFTKEDLTHLFERFYKGEHSGVHSIGIGLALARMILSRQNATIKAENRAEGGARFIIHFYQNDNFVT